MPRELLAEAPAETGEAAARVETGPDKHSLHGLPLQEHILHVSDMFEERRAGFAVEWAERADREDRPANCDTLWEEVLPNECALPESGTVRLAPLIAVVSEVGDAYPTGALGREPEYLLSRFTRAERKLSGASCAVRCVYPIINSTISRVRKSRYQSSRHRTLRLGLLGREILATDPDALTSYGSDCLR